jgi:hypothetical protein
MDIRRNRRKLQILDQTEGLNELLFDLLRLVDADDRACGYEEYIEELKKSYLKLEKNYDTGNSKQGSLF